MTEGNGFTDPNGCICITADNHHASHHMYLWNGPPWPAVLSIPWRASRMARLERRQMASCSAVESRVPDDTQRA